MARAAKNLRHGRSKVKGEPWVWLSGGAVATGIVMILGLVLLIAVEGTVAFWPNNVEAFALGSPRYYVHHEDKGQAWITRDDDRLVFGANDAYRSLDDRPYTGDAGVLRQATLADYDANRALLGEHEITWVVRDVRGNVVTHQGEAVTPAMYVRRPARYLLGVGDDDLEYFYGISADEVWKDRDISPAQKEKLYGRLTLEHPRHGPLFLGDGSALYVQVKWRYANEEPVELAGVEVRRGTIADYREFPELFTGKGPWVIADPNGNVVADDDGAPVSPRTYIDNPADFPSPWGYYTEDGTRETVETLLGDDRWRDYNLLVGATRGERTMDIRHLPPNPDGTPVKPYQIDIDPTEHLVRQGNQAEGLYGGGAYFRWVREDLPDIDTARRLKPETYYETILKRAPLPGAALIERLEGGVLTGYVTRVTVDGEVLADIESDGREGVWKTFKVEQQRMRKSYLERYEIEKDDLGYVQFELKDLEDTLKKIRYDHGESRNIITAMEWLAETYDTWSADEPLDSAHETTEDYAEARTEWLKEFQPLLDQWRGRIDDEEFTEDELAVLNRTADVQLERARIRAEDFARLRYRVNRMRADERKATYTFETSDGKSTELALSHIVRAFRPNEHGLGGKLGIYADRVWEFLTDDPREANTEGGIWPVIIGTLVMVLLMTFAVVPFGVVAALYLREYARQGPVVSAVRIAVNNLAGVPSIVFGIFGLGFFCVMVGGSIDDIFYPELLPAPTFGGGGILWASLTLALLTVPVVVVSTEEALSAVPSSQREASLACGASKFQTVSRVVLPQALPGVLTGTILAMARGAGEVAPLMLVGAVKYAPYPPVDGIPPFVHLERKFMHLGFHIYDVGFQSPNVDNTKPLVFATALVLIVLVAVLNVFAIALRNRLRKKFATSSV